jgi:hypothetical protein
VEYFLGIDEDDQAQKMYRKVFLHSLCSKNKHFGNFNLSVNNTNNIISCVNFLAKKMTKESQLILSISDDMGSMKDWDVNLLELIKDFDNFKETKFIGVSNGFQEYGTRLLYLIVNKAWYNKFGYLIYPEYDGCYSDDDFFQTAIAMKCIIDAPHIIFEHRHPAFGAGKYDFVYARHGNADSISRNLKIFEKRKARNFDLR